MESKLVTHRFYRTIICIESLSAGILTVIIPSWNPYEKIFIPESDIPSKIISEVMPRIVDREDVWLFAKINLGVANKQDIQICSFEDPKNEEGLELIFP